MELTNNSSRKNRRPSIDLTTMVYGKVPPQAKELEEAILGAIMNQAGVFLAIADILTPECFYVDAHQRIYRVFQKLFKRSLPIDVLTVVNELKSSEELDIIGGPYVITRLSRLVSSSANIDAHARIVLEKFIQRELIRISGEVIGDAYEDATDTFDLLDSTERKFRDISILVNSSKKTVIANVAKEVIEDFDRKAYYSQNNEIDPKAVYTCIPEWDRINGQLRSGIYVVAARPSVGKGVHMTELICRMAKKYKVRVINGEMTNKQLLIRVGCNLLNIHNQLWKKIVIEPEDQELVKEAMSAAIQLNFEVFSERLIDRIARQITSWVMDGAQVILADMLNLFSVSDELAKYMNERQQINYILLTLNFLAKELDVPIILYAHMNREILKRAVREPNLGDLKESGKIEDVAFQVSFLHRPELYDNQETEDEWGESIKGLMYQIIVKHRDGETGRIKYDARLAYSKLEERETESIQDWKPSVATPFDGKRLSANDSELNDTLEDDAPF